MKQFKDYFKQLNIDTIFNFLLSVSIGIALSIIINSYIQFRFFSLPPENIAHTKHQVKFAKKGYEYISKIFQTIEKQKNVEKAPVSTNIDISLVGTIILGNKEYALINAGGYQKFVKTGDKINGYKVDKIEKYKVILSKNGKKYLLTVKLNAAKIGLSSKMKSVESKEEVYKVDRRFVQEKTANIGKIMKDIFIAPVVKNGETIGFKFRYIKPGSLLYKYGLRSGDLILSVNGQPITTVEEAFKIYNILRNENYVKIEIERNGKKRVLVYEIQ